MKVKLQPPSGTELPAFNPIVHPSAITQVLLLANPQKVRLRALSGQGHALGGRGTAALSVTLLLPHVCCRRRFACATSSSSLWASRPTTRWGMSTSSPHPTPGGASRTERGWGEEGQGPGHRPAWVGGHTPSPCAWCFSPNPYGSHFASSQAKPNPAGGWARACTVGLLRPLSVVGAWPGRGPRAPEDLQSVGRR